MKGQLPMVDLTMAELRCVYPALAHVAEESMRHPIDPETAEWLDGPSFYRWLRENGLTLTAMFGDSLERRFNRWKNGAAVPLNYADQICCKLDLNLNEIPPECWRAKPRPKGPVSKMYYVPEERRQAAIEDVKAGRATIAEVARREGVDWHSARNWIKGSS